MFGACCALFGLAAPCSVLRARWLLPSATPLLICSLVPQNSVLCLTSHSFGSFVFTVSLILHTGSLYFCPSLTCVVLCCRPDGPTGMRSRNFSATFFSAYGSSPFSFSPSYSVCRLLETFSPTLDNSRPRLPPSVEWFKKAACMSPLARRSSLSHPTRSTLSASFALLLTGRSLSSRFPWYLDPHVSCYLVFLGNGLLCRSPLLGAYLGAGAVYSSVVCDAVCRVSVLMLCSRSIYRLAGQPSGSLDRCP